MHWLTIYNKSSFPANGWIQQCFMCYRATSHTVEYKEDEYTHIVYLCKCCQKKNRSEENNKIYVQDVEQYIKEHTPQPFEVPPISLSPPKIISSHQPDLPRPHSILLQKPYIPPPQPSKKQPIPISPPPPAPPTPPTPPTPQPKSLYDSLFEHASKKLSSYIHKSSS